MGACARIGALLFAAFFLAIFFGLEAFFVALAVRDAADLDFLVAALRPRFAFLPRRAAADFLAFLAMAL